MLTPEQNKLVQDWYAADRNQRHWKDVENQLRIEVVKLTNPDKVSGVENIEIENGWKLTVTKGEDYKLENGHGELEDILDEFDESIAKLIVRWKPELVVKNYKALELEQQSKLGAVLTIKPSSPQVKIVPPPIGK